MNASLPQMYWRVNSEDLSGTNKVSLLLPTSVAGQAREYPIELMLNTTDFTDGNPIHDLEWSEHDNKLFISLLAQVCDTESGKVEVNMQDHVIQEFIHLVATARFQSPMPAEQIEAPDFNTLRFELELGDIVSLNTMYGFIAAVVIDLDSVDATCIIFDDIEDGEGELIYDAGSSLVMSRLSVVHEAFSEDEEVGSYATIH